MIFEKPHLRTDKSPAGNSTYSKEAVQWLNEVLYFVSSSGLADSLVLQKISHQPKV